MGKTFSEKVFETASVDFHNMGISVLSYTIKDISDDEHYLDVLGQGRTAEVKRDAKIGEAEAKKESTIAAAYAEEQRMAAKLINDTEIAKSKRDFELKKATYDVEVNTAKAEAELAYALQEANVRARIMEEEMQVKVVERQQEIKIQEQEIIRRERLLDSTVKKPAEAEKYQIEKIAEAAKREKILRAEAQAEAIALKGEAEAFATEAKQMIKKAEAFKEYKEAALLEMMMKVMPQVAAEIGGPISQTKKITMVSTGDGPVGASKMTGEVMEIMASLPDTVKAMTGVDITQKMLTAK